MKYTKENLASSIVDYIKSQSFNDGFLKFDIEIEFDKCVSCVDGEAWISLDTGDIECLDRVELMRVELFHEDTDVNTLYVSSELSELEKDVKLWW